MIFFLILVDMATFLKQYIIQSENLTNVHFVSKQVEKRTMLMLLSFYLQTNKQKDGVVVVFKSQIYHFVDHEFVWLEIAKG